MTTHIQIEISEDAFGSHYPLRANHLNPNASWTFADGHGRLFETYGEELAFVLQQDERYVWTLVDAGDHDGQYVISGIHLVNRIGYLISTVKWPANTFIQVPIPSDTSERFTDAECGR